MLDVYVQSATGQQDSKSLGRHVRLQKYGLPEPAFDKPTTPTLNKTSNRPSESMPSPPTHCLMVCRFFAIALLVRLRNACQVDCWATPAYSINTFSRPGYKPLNSVTIDQNSPSENPTSPSMTSSSNHDAVPIPLCLVNRLLAEIQAHPLAEEELYPIRTQLQVYP